MSNKTLLQLKKSIKEEITFSQKENKQNKGNHIVLFSLNESSLQKYHQLDGYLKDVQDMMESTIQDITKIAQSSKKDEDNLKKYNEDKKKIKKEIENNEQNLIYTNNKIRIVKIEKEKNQEQIKLLQKNIEELQKNLSHHKKELKKAWIPFYSLAILKELENIEKYTIPELDRKINVCQIDINNYQRRIENSDLQTEKLEKSLQGFNEIKRQLEKTDKDIEKTIAELHTKISGAIKQYTYLSILQTRIQAVVTDTKMIHELMFLLDQEPEVIHYDDNKDYFELLEKWNEKKDIHIFNDFIMKSEKTFFTSN